MRHQIKRLGDFCKTGSGGTPSRSQLDRYYEGGNIPWVKSGELREGLIASTEEHVTEAALRESSIKLVPAGAILLAMYGATVGRLAILGVEATTNQAVCHIIPDPDEADTRYLYHAISAQVPAIIAMGVGGAQPNISQGLIKDLKVSLPPLPEQRRIAAILDQADALRTKRREALAQLDSLTQSIFVEMFGKQNGIQSAQLGKIVSMKRGPFGGALKKEIFVPEGPMVYEQRNAIQDDCLTGRYFISEAKYREMEDFAVLPNDLIVSCSGTIGKVAIAPQNAPKGIINQALLRIRVDASTASPIYLKHVLESQEIQNRLTGLSHGTGLQNFPPMSEVKALEIPLPSIEKQRAFETQLHVVAEQKEVMNESATELVALFASLQHRAFRGEL